MIAQLIPPVRAFLSSSWDPAVRRAAASQVTGKSKAAGIEQPDKLDHLKESTSLALVQTPILNCEGCLDDNVAPVAD
jgi:hypothetical protein